MFKKIVWLSGVLVLGLVGGCAVNESEREAETVTDVWSQLALYPEQFAGKEVELTGFIQGHKGEEWGCTKKLCTAEDPYCNDCGQRDGNKLQIFETASDMSLRGIGLDFSGLTDSQIIDPADCGGGNLGVRCLVGGQFISMSSYYRLTGTLSFDSDYFQQIPLINELCDPYCRPYLTLKVSGISQIEQPIAEYYLSGELSTTNVVFFEDGSVTYIDQNNAPLEQTRFQFTLADTDLRELRLLRNNFSVASLKNYPDDYQCPRSYDALVSDYVLWEDGHTVPIDGCQLQIDSELFQLIDSLVGRLR